MTSFQRFNVTSLEGWGWDGGQVSSKKTNKYSCEPINYYIVDVYFFAELPERNPFGVA